MQNRKSYPRRYADNWSQTSRKARNSVAGRCSCCWVRSSDQTHHVQYQDLFGRIAGREVPGWHVFPVCGSTDDRGTCHHWLHSGGRWIRNGELGSRNQIRVIWLLRFRYWLLWFALRVWPVVVFVGAVVWFVHK